MAKFVPQEEMSLLDQVQVRRDKLAALQAEGRDPFQITKFDFNADSAAIKADYAAFEGKIVRVAGRLMSKRGMGKVLFCDLQDNTGRIQLFVKIDEMGEEEFNRFKRNDIGDIVGAEGEVFTTKTGEISIRTKSIQLLSKSPEQFAPGQWPAYAAKAKGCEVWDLDGKHYYDMTTNGIGACLLGYADPDVTAAVVNRIENGSMSTLNCPEEVALADKL